MSTQAKPFLTPEQYLEIERAAEYKSEYFNGEMFAMAGGTLDHAMIASDVSGILRAQLRGRPCRIAGSDLRLQVSPDGLYTYPDIVVFCGKAKLADAHRDTITDATAIIEVLSPSTENYDRGFKFEQYRGLPSLKDYVVLAQNRVHVEHWTRQTDGSWNLRETSDPDAVIQLPSIECSFRVGEAYERVDIEAGERSPGVSGRNDSDLRF
jgi:Uma2 family endonuclease